ncbi:MAG: hypothetical protein AAF611_03615 [Bacteroidota bacterium]
MKRIYLGLLAVLLTFCTSCEFSETIYINEDGTGKMSMYLDGSELMPMIGGQISVGKWNSIDSTISFKELLKEAKMDVGKLSSADRSKVKSLEKVNMHMQIDSDKNKLNVDVFSDFKSVNDLQNMFTAMNVLGDLGAKNNKLKSNPLSSVDVGEVSSMEYSFKNNVFKRSFRVKNEKLIDSLKQNLGQAQMLFAASTYKLDYHFPKKIKSVSVEDAVIGKDGKSFTLKVNVMDFVNNPEILNFEVELEE